MPAIAARARFVPVLGALLLAAAPGPARAELDPAKLAAGGQAMLDNYVKLSEGALQPKGEVTASRDGDVVILTVPALTIDNAEANVEIPSSALRLEETGEDRVAFVVTLPDAINGTTTAPKPGELLIRLGGQKIDGIYRPSLLTFERLDLKLDDLSVESPDGSLALGTVQVDMASAETATSKWHSDGRMALANLRVLDGAKAPLFSIGRFEQMFRIENYDLPKLADLQRELTGSANPFLMMSEPDEAKAAAFAQAYFERMPEMLEGAGGGIGFRLADLQVTAPEQPPFSLGSAGVDVGLGPDDALYALRLALEVNEPRVDPMAAPVPPHLMPRSAKAEADLRRLPLAPLWDAISAPMREAMRLEMEGKMTPDAEQALNEQMEMMPMVAMGMAAEAGSFAEIRTFNLSIGPARLSARGVGPLVPGLPEPPLRIEAVIEGLEDLAAEVQKLQPEMQEQAMPILVMLRGLGKPAAQNDKVVHTYLIEQTPQGAIVVNGVSLEELGGKPQ